jgi:hypothetical protein
MWDVLYRRAPNPVASPVQLRRRCSNPNFRGHTALPSRTDCMSQVYWLDATTHPRQSAPMKRSAYLQNITMADWAAHHRELNLLRSHLFRDRTPQSLHVIGEPKPIPPSVTVCWYPAAAGPNLPERRSRISSRSPGNPWSSGDLRSTLGRGPLFSSCELFRRKRRRIHAVLADQARTTHGSRIRSRPAVPPFARIFNSHRCLDETARR